MYFVVQYSPRCKDLNKGWDCHKRGVCVLSLFFSFLDLLTLTLVPSPRFLNARLARLKSLPASKEKNLPMNTAVRVIARP